MSESSISSTSAASPPVETETIGGGKQARRHRPREETRALLLDAAARVAVRRVSAAPDESHNVLADVRIKDVLVEMNSAGSAAGGRAMTTGAFYQIWSDQAEFQRELLAHVMEQIAVPGSDEIEALAFQMVSDGEPADEILRQISDLDFRVSQSPELYLALGMGALASAQLVKDAQREANRRYLASLSELLHNVLRYAGRRLREDRSMEDLIWATEALEVGYLLRARTDPEVPERTDRRGWTARATAYVGIVHAFTEEIPGHTRR